MRIVVGICTFRRESLLATLDSVAGQELPPDATLQVLVADNDETPVHRQAIIAHARYLQLPLTYIHAPARNISIARNACLEAARGDCLIFIDDDEVADPGWILRLVSVWRQSAASVVFGPALAVYPESAPRWMRDNDFHSNIPTHRSGLVETGYTSNVLLDLGNAEIALARFDPAYGRTGGEDVDFFFRLHRAGVEMAIAEEARVREHVTPARMNFGWLLRRRYAGGVIYGSCAARDDIAKRAAVLGQSLVKAIYCAVRTLLSVTRSDRCIFWFMRAAFHIGVMSGCIAPPRREVYGETA